MWRLYLIFAIDIPGLTPLIQLLKAIWKLILMMWQQIKCGVILAICFMVQLLWSCIAAFITFFANLLTTATGGVGLDLNPVIDYAKYVNCIIPLDIAAGLVTVYGVFLIGFIVYKQVRKSIPTIG